MATCILLPRRWGACGEGGRGARTAKGSLGVHTILGTAEHYSKLRMSLGQMNETQFLSVGLAMVVSHADTSNHQY
jgi:hypothetical protein